MKHTKELMIIEDKEDMIIKAVKDEEHAANKKRLFLDVDGTLVAMEFDPEYTSRGEVDWKSVHRTDFCHWLNSISSILDSLCEVFVLTNFTYENEKKAKEIWLKDNLKCKYRLILNKEGITKSLFVRGQNDILVDDTFRNLIEWYKAGGTQIASQWTSCEKGRRDLLAQIVKKV